MDVLACAACPGSLSSHPCFIYQHPSPSFEHHQLHTSLTAILAAEDVIGSRGLCSCCQTSLRCRRTPTPHLRLCRREERVRCAWSRGTRPPSPTKALPQSRFQQLPSRGSTSD
ncbi:hypothetical protein BD311DRAFT_768896, partial [Dichomitus squalens]